MHCPDMSPRFLGFNRTQDLDLWIWTRAWKLDLPPWLTCQAYRMPDIKMLTRLSWSSAPCDPSWWPHGHWLTGEFEYLMTWWFLFLASSGQAHPRWRRPVSRNDLSRDIRRTRHFIETFRLVRSLCIERWVSFLSTPGALWQIPDLSTLHHKHFLSWKRELIKIWERFLRESWETIVWTW